MEKMEKNKTNTCFDYIYSVLKKIIMSEITSQIWFSYASFIFPYSCDIGQLEDIEAVKGIVT